MSRKDYLLASVSQHGLFSERYFSMANPNKMLKQRRRDEFGLAIRPIFLKFLAKVEHSAMRRVFTESQIHDLSCGSIDNFNIHHLRGLDIGGTNYNPEFTSIINNIYLPKHEIQSIPHRYYLPIVFKRRLEHFLKDQERHGRLEQTFRKLFSGYLVFLPKALHDKMEKQLIYPTITAARENGERKILLPYTTRLFIDPTTKAFRQLSEKRITQFSVPTPARVIASHRTPESVKENGNSHQREE